MVLWTFRGYSLALLSPYHIILLPLLFRSQSQISALFSLLRLQVYVPEA